VIGEYRVWTQRRHPGASPQRERKREDAVRRDRAEVADFLQRGFCDRRRGDAQEALRNAVEGIVSKNVEAPYRLGRKPG
jgi:ATP-dependent DNA ligase